MDNSQYYVTENEVSKLLAGSGLPNQFQYAFTKDYVALKRNISDNSLSIESLDDRLTLAEANIVSLNVSFATLNTTVSTLSSNFNAHTAATSAHGASGNIVGTNNYCTAVLGGTVLQATAVTAASTSTVNVTLSPNTAGVGYVQADAATWVAMLAEHKTAINQLKTDLNAAITQLNLSLTTETTAKQRA